MNGHYWCALIPNTHKVFTRIVRTRSWYVLSQFVSFDCIIWFYAKSLFAQPSITYYMIIIDTQIKVTHIKVKTLQVSDDQLINTPVLVGLVWQIATYYHRDLTLLQLLHSNLQCVCLPFQFHHDWGAHSNLECSRTWCKIKDIYWRNLWNPPKRFFFMWQDLYGILYVTLSKSTKPYLPHKVPKSKGLDSNFY